MEWITNNIIALIAICVSLISVLITISLNRRERPTIMPSGQEVSANNHLSFMFKNGSEFTLLKPSILITCFDRELNEIAQLSINDRYNFDVPMGEVIHYGFSIQNLAKDGLFIRVRFTSSFRIKLPMFNKRKFTQELWHSMLPIHKDGDQIHMKVSTTHRDEIEKLQAKHGDMLDRYDAAQDKKFKI